MDGRTFATDPPTLFALLGVAGDLARRLVATALFELYRADRLPSQFSLLVLNRADSSHMRQLKRAAHILPELHAIYVH
jgi:glucose-6-phosphate 1-dehydrogenase